MNAIPEYPIFQFALWRSILAARTEQGYAVFEASDRFWRERLTEAVLRVAGVSLILVGYVQWFLPVAMLNGDPVVVRTALSVLFMGAGIALYLFACRGFRKKIFFDVLDRRISIGRLNTKDCSLIGRQIRMDRIESLFIGRDRKDRQLATLNMRVKWSPRTHCIMRGAPTEIEELHRQLCRDIQIALAVPDGNEAASSHLRQRPSLRARRAGTVSAFRTVPSDDCAMPASGNVRGGVSTSP